MFIVYTVHFRYIYSWPVFHLALSLSLLCSCVCMHVHTLSFMCRWSRLGWWCVLQKDHMCQFQAVGPCNKGPYCASGQWGRIHPEQNASWGCTEACWLWGKYIHLPVCHAQLLSCLSSSVSVGYSWLVIKYQVSIKHSLLVEHQTRDQKVASLNPGSSGGRIFFFRVNFLCWLLVCVYSTPCYCRGT